MLESAAAAAKRSRRILLINPTMTSRRSARFPISLLALAGSLDGHSTCRIIDGNVDRDYLATIGRPFAGSPSMRWA